LGFRCMR